MSLDTAPIAPENASADLGSQSARRFDLGKGVTLDVGVSPPGAAAPAAGRGAYAPPHLGRRGALFMLVEGAPAESTASFHDSVQRAVERDRGTATARLLRAVREACGQLESQALHRYELAGLGLSALLVEDGVACFTQLPPCQAFVLDPDGLRALPEEPMWGATRVASATGRRWEVEIDVYRLTIRPGITIALCPSSAAVELSRARIESLLRLPPAEAAAAIVQHRARGEPGRLAQREAVVLRASEARPAARPRLLTAGHQRPARARPVPPSTWGPVEGSGRPSIEAWGLRRRARRRLFGWPRGEEPPDFVAAHPRRPWVLLVGVAAFACLGLGVWVARPAGLSSTPPPAAEAGAAAVTLSRPAPLSGRTVLVASQPFRSFAVAGGVARVLDAAGQVTTVPPGGENGRQPVPVPAPEAPGTSGAPSTGAPGLLAGGEGDVLYLDRGRSLWLLGAAGPRPVAIRAASLWRRPVATTTYAGNLYVLDAGPPAQIWRHARGATGSFDGDAQAWLQAGVSLDGATSLAIDGAIWVCRADGTILRLANGRPEPFEPSGLSTPIVAGGPVYTEREFQSLYVVDAAARRLVQLAKDGRVAAEVPELFPVGEHPLGLWVDEPGRRALVLTDRRLQEVEL